MPKNKWLVGVQGEQIVVGLPLRAARMTKDEALELAAWLVALSTEKPEVDFQPILESILET